MEFSLLGAVVFAVVPLYLVARLENRIGNSHVAHREVTDLAISAIVAGVLVGRLAAMVLDGVNPLTNPADILIIRGGVATVPATITALAVVAWYARPTLWLALDSLAAPALAGLSGWHAGCIVRDSCLGSPSELPWAVAQGGSTITRHPVEIYAALLLLAAAAALVLWRKPRRRPIGVAAAAALGFASLARLVTEPLRPTLGDGLSGWYAATVVISVLLAAWRYRAASTSDGE